MLSGGIDRKEWHARRLMLQRESYSDIPVLKIISVLVSIKFELNHFSISFYTVAELFSVLVSIKILEIISVQFQSQYLHHFSNSFCHRQYSNTVVCVIYTIAQ